MKQKSFILLLNWIALLLAPLAALHAADVLKPAVETDSRLHADGYGWFVGSTVAGPPAAGRMDLLTVMTHELGHILGLGEPRPGSCLMI